MIDFSFHRGLKKIPVWFTAVITSIVIIGAVLIVLTLISDWKLPIRESSEQNIYSKCEDYMFVAEGINPLGALNQGLGFLYKSKSDDEKISYALIQSYFAEIFGDENQFEDLLGSDSDAPFKFVVKDVEDGIVWTLSTSLPEYGDDLVDSLHKSFADGFSPALVRERTVPTGRIVRDIIVDEVGVTESKERWRTYQMRESNHFESGDTFITAARGRNLVLGNDKNLVMEVVESAPASATQFFASASGLHLFSLAFPDSDVLRHFSGLISDGDEGHLSLSSWQCIP